jgi:hypothetical protein
MKMLSIASLLLVGIALALSPAIGAIYGAAFPAEPEKRAALAACAQDKPGFDRLLADERAKCYARQLPTPEAPERVPRSEEIAEAGF